MNNSMEFTSQICTTKEQSGRLLTLGLKKETADMYYPTISEDEHTIRACWEDFWDSRKAIDAYIRRRCIPAWSFHRLIVLSGMGIIESTTDNIYDKVIQYIEFLIKCGDFNKEYLED